MAPARSLPIRCAEAGRLGASAADLPLDQIVEELGPRPDASDQQVVASARATT